MDIALFSPSSLFPDEDESSNDEGTSETQQSYEERKHQFPGMELIIREFSFHELNANLLWPGTFAFAEWLVQNPSWIRGRKCIELGSGTGSLAIFLRKSFNLDITTSDYDDQEIEDNIAYNCSVNGIAPALPHIKQAASMSPSAGFYFVSAAFSSVFQEQPRKLVLYTWGENFPISDPDWDLVIASDILLYFCIFMGHYQTCSESVFFDPGEKNHRIIDVKQYQNLIKTLSYLLTSYNYKRKCDEMASQNDEGGESLAKPMFVMSWRRRIGKEDELLFFSGCENAGLEVKHLGSRVYCIQSIK